MALLSSILPSLCLQAPAKVNLFLKVLGKRPDGYHDLETWMQKLDLCDRITLTLRDIPGISLRCAGGDLPADGSNLAWRAAAAFFAASRHAAAYGVDIVLEKIIPVAAGLGGGSSDAGAVLRGLNNLFGDELPVEMLLELGRRLGADVPFFVSGHDAVLATGIGDRMEAVDSLRHCTFLLVNPGFSVSTQWVYENFTLTKDVKKSTVSGSQKLDSGTFPLTKTINDLEGVTIGRYPEIADIKRKLLAAGAVSALMSGSGPTVFGVFPDREGPHSADISGVAHRLRQEFGEKIFVARAAGAGA
ncbi:MAG: 4-(cytidine 5'-diphospho)-2-C-methyl-D-erythritol kinase [Desulfocapsaceae bacterium]|nr:4-(cytidine 5'-diphospho)-2-C-methyl-D-erythritol kinase [Desulfocapsaceae bacterium]